MFHPFDTHASTSLLIKNGRVIDPANSIDAVMTVAIQDGRIVSVAPHAPENFEAEDTIDATGQWVVPGLIDMHVHLREPGREDKETIETGTQAAAAGGFTGVACMPNTTPPLDDPSRILYVVERSRAASCRVYPVGAITRNLAGELLTDFEEMIDAGACAFSDDGKSVFRSHIMRQAFESAKIHDVPLLCHCEDADLVKNGSMNEGPVSHALGVSGIPTIAEDIIVARDIMLAHYTGSSVHICHVSTEQSVELVRIAKRRGVAVTAETCPHYWIFSDQDLRTPDTNKKMNPPLRSAADRQAILEGLRDGTIDVIASDHAPHCLYEKNQEFSMAPFGIIGLETSLGAVIHHLLRDSVIDPATLVRKMSIEPARILNIDAGSLSVGKSADITIIDPNERWVVDPTDFYSKSRNTPFAGMTLTGRARHTIINGIIVYSRDI